MGAHRVRVGAIGAGFALLVIFVLQRDTEAGRAAFAGVVVFIEAGVGGDAVSVDTAGSEDVAVGSRDGGRRGR